MKKGIAVAAITLGAYFLPAAEGAVFAADDPVITYTYPAHTKFPERRVPCDTLIKLNAQNGLARPGDRIKKLIITCEFGEAVDGNNQRVCISGSTNPYSPKSVGQSYADAFLHYATGHNMNVPDYVKILQSLGKTQDQIENHSSRFVRDYVKNPGSWTGLTPLTSVRAACKRAYQERGLWAE